MDDGLAGLSHVTQNLFNVRAVADQAIPLPFEGVTP